MSNCTFKLLDSFTVLPDSDYQCQYEATPNGPIIDRECIHKFGLIGHKLAAIVSKTPNNTNLNDITVKIENNHTGAIKTWKFNNPKADKYTRRGFWTCSEK